MLRKTQRSEYTDKKNAGTNIANPAETMPCLPASGPIQNIPAEKPNIPRTALGITAARGRPNKTKKRTPQIQKSGNPRSVEKQFATTTPFNAFVLGIPS